jgi:hypothetical protein
MYALEQSINAPIKRFATFSGLGNVVSQWFKGVRKVSHLPTGSQEVTGSIPVSSTNKINNLAKRPKSRNRSGVTLG